MTSGFERTVPTVLAETQPRSGFFEALLQALREMSSGRMGVVEPEPAPHGHGTWVVAGVAAGAVTASGVFLGVRRHRRAVPQRSDRLDDRLLRTIRGEGPDERVRRTR
ncbi:MAG: hypothetical protein ACRDJ5_01240 [Actinomycetota bacterium]